MASTTAVGAASSRSSSLSWGWADGLKNVTSVGNVRRSGCSFPCGLARAPPPAFGVAERRIGGRASSPQDEPDGSVRRRWETRCGHSVLSVFFVCETNAIGCGMT